MILKLQDDNDTCKWRTILPYAHEKKCKAHYVTVYNVEEGWSKDWRILGVYDRLPDIYTLAGAACNSLTSCLSAKCHKCS